MENTISTSDLSGLSECIVQQVFFENNLSRLIIVVNDIFDGHGAVRPDIESRPKPVRITCELVEEVAFQGGLRAWGLLQDPSQIGWSHSELDTASVERVATDATKLVLKFGGSRSLSVTCQRIHYLRLT